MPRKRTPVGDVSDLLLVVGLAAAMLGLAAVAAGVGLPGILRPAMYETQAGTRQAETIQDEALTGCPDCPCDRSLDEAREVSKAGSCRSAADPATSPARLERAIGAPLPTEAAALEQRPPGEDDPRQFLTEMANSRKQGNATGHQSAIGHGDVPRDVTRQSTIRDAGTPAGSGSPARATFAGDR